MKASLLALAAIAASSVAWASELTEEKLRAVLARAEAAADSTRCVNLTIQGAAGYTRWSDDELRGKCLLDLALTNVGPDHPLVGAALFRLGSTYREQRRYPEAIDHLERALAHRERSYGPDDARLLEYVEMLGWTWLDVAQYEKAVPPLRRALAIAERKPATPPWFVAQEAHMLARALMGTKAFAEVEKLELRALQLTERVGPPHDIERVKYLTQLAAAQMAMGRNGDADRSAQRALGLLDSLDIPAMNWERATALLMVAEVREAQMRLKEAQALRAQALEIRKRYGAGPAASRAPAAKPKAVVLNGGQCDFFDAMAQAVEQFHGEEHPALVPQLYLLGYCWEDGGRLDDAEASYERALAIREKAFGSRGPGVQASRAVLDEFRRKHGRNPR